jgi:group I intron endonuclease
MATDDLQPGNENEMPPIPGQLGAVFPPDDPDGSKARYKLAKEFVVFEQKETPFEKVFKVYKHTSPGRKVYIGITSLKENNRWRNGGGYKNNPHFKRAIDKYGWNNFKHEVLFSGLTKDEAEKIEISLIKSHNSTDKKFGYNLLDGGQCGAFGVKRRPETLVKMSIANKGKVVPKEVRVKISKSLKGKQFTIQHRRKISEAQMGCKNHRFGTTATVETRQKMSDGQPKSVNHMLSKKVAQYSLSGEFIRVWDSMGDIRRCMGIKHCTISDCCRGKQLTSGGFVWKYWQ